MANISKDNALNSKPKTAKINQTVNEASANTNNTKTAKKSSIITKTTRKTSTKKKQKETGDIKEASIAKFMRKRTQLVGFDYGNFKHTQYAVEFADNALDAIEKFQWDAIVAYEDLRNHMERVSNEFAKFEFDVQKLNELVEKQVTDNKKPTKGIVTKLSNLYQLKPIIYQKILDVYNEYGDNIEEIAPFIPITITISNFNEEYKKFSSEIDEIYEKYNNILLEVYNLNKNPKFMFTMDEAISLENLKYVKSSEDIPVKIKLRSLLGEHPEKNSIDKSEIDTSDPTQISTYNSDLQTNQTENQINILKSSSKKKKIRGGIEKKEEDAIRALKDLAYDFLSPVREIINKEPMVIIKLQEEEAPEVLWEKGDRSDSLLYTFEIFDNGTGMTLPDFEKFGKYLASSKSQKLRQTRGSQGFGSPSAFSDAQNTTGKPIVVISKHSSDFEGICSEFYTTENNTKEYIVKPTEIEVFFLHGTYIKLSYLNKKYTRGYIDTYVEKVAMMNTHVTFIYIDPYGEEHLFRRKIDKFPNEPKFALPHPSSIKIGEFQDLLRSSKKLTVTAFLADSFVRMSNILAKTIVSDAEFELEQKLRIFNFEIGFLSVMTIEDDKLLFIKEEKRVFGRSTKPRLMKIIYEISDKDFKYSVWTQLEIYNQNLKKKESFEKKQRNFEKSLKKESNKKKLKEKQKEIKVLDKYIEKEVKSMGIVKANIKKLLLKATFEIEIENNTIKEKMFNNIRDLLISKTKPSDLTQNQIEFLYMAFKDKKYMTPPTDTAVPVGEISLETAIIKEHNLQISNKVDFFGDSAERIQQIGNFEKKNLINRNLIKFNDPKLFISDDNNPINFSFSEDGINKNVYTEMIFNFDITHTMGDDFIAAHTRKPTSGKGLAFVVEAVMAYSPQIPFAKKASSVVSRYVNRTPKMRDNSDCALWMGIQSVNWKKYKVKETFDNGIPKGNYVLYINCSGPYTHLMFKSQSKNALAVDDVLLKEVKLCLEVIGRKLKNYMNKKEYREQNKEREKSIKKNIPTFADSLCRIAKSRSKFSHLDKLFLEKKMLETLQEIISPKKSLKKTIDHEIKSSDKEQQFPKPNVEKVELLKDFPEKITKKPKEITESEIITKKPKKTIKPGEVIKQEKKDTLQTTIEMYTLNEQGIRTALKDGKWYTIREIIKKMRISSMMDARYLSTKLKMMAKKGSISAGKKADKIVWKIK